MSRITIQYHKDSYEKMDQLIKSENLTSIIALSNIVIYRCVVIKSVGGTNSLITSTIGISKNVNIDKLDRMLVHMGYGAK